MFFCFQPNWHSSLGRCRKRGHHSKEDLAKSGNKPYVKYKTFNHPSIFLATQLQPNIEIFLLFYSSLLTIENLQNHFIFEFLMLFFGEIQPIIKGRLGGPVPSWGFSFWKRECFETPTILKFFFLLILHGFSLGVMGNNLKKNPTSESLHTIKPLAARRTEIGSCAQLRLTRTLIPTSPQPKAFRYHIKFPNY